MAINRIVFANKALIDLRRDTVTAATLAKGKTAHDKSGKVITGTASLGDIQSISVTQLPAPSMNIIGNVYKYSNEYYCCTFNGKLNVETGVFDDSFKLVFPPADDLYNAVGSQPDGTEILSIGYSDSDYTPFILTMYGGYDAVITAGTYNTFQLNQYTTTEISPHWLGLGNQIIYVTDLGNQIFNSDVPCCMVNMTTGVINGGGSSDLDSVTFNISRPPRGIIVERATILYTNPATLEIQEEDVTTNANITVTAARGTLVHFDILTDMELIVSGFENVAPVGGQGYSTSDNVVSSYYFTACCGLNTGEDTASLTISKKT